jgi:hypothetical protein
MRDCIGIMPIEQKTIATANAFASPCAGCASSNAVSESTNTALFFAV